MPDLKKVLQHSSTPATRELDVAELWNTARRRARRARMLAALGVVLVVAASSVAAATLDLGGRDAQQLPIGNESASPEEQESPEVDEDDDDDDQGSGEARSCANEGVLCIAVDRPWSIVGAGFGSAWVGNIGEGDTFGVARFDAETGDEVARLRTRGFVEGFAPDDSWMWALLTFDENVVVLKIDPRTTEVDEEFELGPAGDIGNPSIVTGAGFAWVSRPEGSLTRLSAEGDTTDFAYASDLPGYTEDNGPVNLAFGEDRVWLTYGLGHVGEVDPESGELVRVHEDALGVNAYEVVYAAGRLWSSHQAPSGANVVTYVSTNGDPGTRGQVELQEAIPGNMATDGESVWVVQDGFGARDPGWLIEVDTQSPRVARDPLEISTEFAGSVAVGEGYVWVGGKGVLYRVTP
jgi:hypothetical protein